MNRHSQRSRARCSGEEATLVLHIVPLGALSDSRRTMSPLFTEIRSSPSLGRFQLGPQMTFDGALLVRDPDADGKIGLYTHFYRNGIVEAVTPCCFETRQVGGQRLIPHVAFEESLLNTFQCVFESLRQLGVRPPVMVSLTLIGVRGLRMAVGGFSFDYGRRDPGREPDDSGNPCREFRGRCRADSETNVRSGMECLWTSGIAELRCTGNWSPRRGA